MNRIEVDVVIIGAGFAGVCAAIELRQSERHSFVVLEKSEGIGGTWLENHYPGVECDIPSHLYSYSFALNPRWSKRYATGEEIKNYIKECTEQYNVKDKIVFGTEVKSALWNGHRWILQTADGKEYYARYVIAATGPLHTANIPDIPGMDSFEGEVFHTAHWRHDVDLTGLRVGMVGTGATAVQVAPEVAKIAKELYVFQRSPIWVAPKTDPVYTTEEQALFARDEQALRTHRWDQWHRWETAGLEMVSPGSSKNEAAEQIARQHIIDAVQDPELVKKLVPEYNYTCKRPTYSNVYYPMFNRENVHLVTDPIESLTSKAVVTSAAEVELDVLVLATGFKAWNLTAQMSVRGVDGRLLDDVWRPHITSYRSVMADGFPNFFIMLGPNSGGLTSAVQMIEAQSQFIIRAIDYVESSGGTALSPKTEEVEKFSARMQELLAKTTMNKGCTSWWSDGKGYNHVVWPGSSVTYRAMLQDFHPEHFELV